MLQQTQVSTVLPYFARWTKALPNFASLAKASEARVLHLWQGLGYYSRARNLHRLSRILADKSAPPRTAAAWQELPGVGPYTAAAITSIAFSAKSACVDGNVVRVLARLTGDGRLFRDGGEAAASFRPLANHLLSPASPGDHNQAMMELGATICTRSSPRCKECPIRLFCSAARSSDPESFPRFRPKKVQRLSVSRVWCESPHALLLHRADSRARRLADLYELPTPEQAGLAAASASRLPLLAVRKRRITRFAITESIRKASAPRAIGNNGLRWVPWAKLDSISLSGPHRRWIQEIRARRSDAP